MLKLRLRADTFRTFESRIAVIAQVTSHFRNKTSIQDEVLHEPNC